MKEKYQGNDNYGKPKQLFLDKIADLSDESLKDQCETLIWLSAYAANNPRSDYHWQVDACYDEFKKRDKLSLYQEAYDRASATM